MAATTQQKERVKKAQKRVNTAKQALRLMRSRRRQLVSEQPDEARAVAYTLLPRTRRHTGQLIRAQRKGLLHTLKKFNEAEAVDQPELEGKVARQAAYLYGLIETSKAKGARSRLGFTAEPKAPSISEAKAGKRRKPLALPVQYNVPTPDTIVILARLLAVDTKRRPGESTGSAVQKLRSLTKRALVRYVNNLRTMTPEAALHPAVSATLKEDSSAIEAESLAGGTVQDPVADKMDEIVVPLDEDLTIAVEDLMPYPPAEDIGPTGVPVIVALAEKEEAEALSEPANSMDQAIADVLRSDEPVKDEEVQAIAKVESEVVPFYKNPIFIGGAALAGVFGLWYLYSRRAVE